MIFFRNILMTVTFLAFASWVVVVDTNDTTYVTTIDTTDNTKIVYDAKGEKQAASMKYFFYY